MAERTGQAGTHSSVGGQENWGGSERFPSALLTDGDKADEVRVRQADDDEAGWRSGAGVERWRAGGDSNTGGIRQYRVRPLPERQRGL